MPKRKLKIKLPRRPTVRRDGNIQVSATTHTTTPKPVAPKKQMTTKTKATIAGAVVGAATVAAVAAGVGIAIAKHKKPKPKPRVPEFDLSLQVTPSHEINHKAIFDNDATHNDDVTQTDFSKEFDEWLEQGHHKEYSYSHLVNPYGSGPAIYLDDFPGEIRI